MTRSRRQVRSNFSRLATKWAAYYTDPDLPISSIRRRHLIARQRFALEMIEAVIPPSSRILDAGCGSGVMAASLVEAGYSVWGIDCADAMIRIARKCSGSDQFVVGDIERTPFPDSAFDAVVSLGVLEYLESDEQALREIRRVLRPGGRAVIALANGRSPLRRLDGVLQGAVGALWPTEAPWRAVHRTPYRRFYRSRWLRLLRSANFELEDWVCHGWGWLTRPVGLLVQVLSMPGTVFRRGVDRLFGPALLSRATDTLVRSRALNWLGGEHVFRVRAIK